jgi:Uma2 family endonuclease
MYKVIEQDENNHYLVEEQDGDYAANGSYTYADYCKWKIEERLELIKGWIYKMSAPTAKHQFVSMQLSIRIGNFLQKKTCRVFAAPFDVRLSKNKSTKDEDVETVVQPDIVVICDLAKIDSRGCIGSPDLVVEILSPSNNKVEIKKKFDLYEENQIKEYWIVHPEEKTVIVYSLQNDKYIGSRLYGEDDLIVTEVLQGIEIKAEDLFDY